MCNIEQYFPHMHVSNHWPFAQPGFESVSWRFFFHIRDDEPFEARKYIFYDSKLLWC